MQLSSIVGRHALNHMYLTASGKVQVKLLLELLPLDGRVYKGFYVDFVAGRSTTSNTVTRAWPDMYA